jgi:two-component system OmpR family response regulator/two-component system response regulator QseB
MVDAARETWGDRGSGVGGQPSALLAEDDEELATALAAQLAGMGYRVRVVLDGEAALAALRDHDPAMLVVDIGLPKRDGIAIAQAARRRGATFPIVAMTGWRDAGIHERARAAGCDLVLRKPFTADELQQAIECACAVAAYMD